MGAVRRRYKIKGMPIRGLYIAVVVLVFRVMAQAQSVSINLQPLIGGGLNQPLYLTNAHDGSNRIFILEQPGIVSVLQPGSSTRTTFLDIRSRVLSGGERGLLGLAFHPQFATNGRFFVDYTRQPDGATVIAEYQLSNQSPNVAGTAEKVLLVIPQPYENHNGGMVEFGLDGFLYIGMGDGGSGNDPQNRAQNTRELLGKILRIDVDHAAPPPTNPFASGALGRPEIYALGLRNPFRFSFDRATGILYAGDVGQDVREEVDIITLGGNYGWRVFEGTRCTGLGPAPCSSSGFIPPIAEYDHSTNGRCSIIGGYVYRGSRQSLPYGAYIYGDYCSGEIFMLQAGIQSVLTRTSLNITSFGEDESGELYVISQGGMIDRITNPGVTFASTRTFSIADRGASSITSLGSASLNTGYARIQVSGSILPAGMAILGNRQNGVLLSETVVPSAPLISSGRIYAEVDVQLTNVNTAVAIANPNSEAVTISFMFSDESGNDFGAGSTVIPANHQIAVFLTEPPFSVGRTLFQGTFTFRSSLLVSVFAIRGRTAVNFSAVSIPVTDLDAPPGGIQTIPHFAWGGSVNGLPTNPKWLTTIELVNPTDGTISGSMHAFDAKGQTVTLQSGNPVVDIAYSIPPHSAAQYLAPALSRFNPFPPAEVQVNSLRITPSAGSAAPAAAAIVSYADFDAAMRPFRTETSIPAIAAGAAFRAFVQNLGNFGSPESIQPAIAIANPTGSPAVVTLQLFAMNGTPAGLSGSVSIPSNGQTAVFLNQIGGFSSLPPSSQGVLRVSSDSSIAVTVLQTRHNELGHFLMTSTPAVPENYAPASSELLFPHFATGGGYEMQVVLFAARSAPVPAGTIYFFEQNGNPLTLQLQ